MFLSVVTVAFRNYEGVVKTWRSLRNLARDPGLSFEWIVVDGGSEDGTREFLQNVTVSLTCVLSVKGSRYL